LLRATGGGSGYHGEHLGVHGHPHLVREAAKPTPNVLLHDSAQRHADARGHPDAGAPEGEKLGAGQLYAATAAKLRVFANATSATDLRFEESAAVCLWRLQPRKGCLRLPRLAQWSTNGGFGLPR
jgi:hypothetical protein